MVCVNVRSCVRALSKSALRRSSALAVYLYAKSLTCRISDASWSVSPGEVGGEGFFGDDGFGGVGMGILS